MEHHVYFWLVDEKKNLSDQADFESGLKSLLGISEVKTGIWARPAATEVRPVTENTWDYALSIKFASRVEHDAYQVHPDHDRFVAKYKDWWAKVQVMDLEESVVE